MERGDSEDRTAATAAPSLILLRPTVATAWNGPVHETIREPASATGLELLKAASEREDTVWVETSLEVSEESEDAWFDGSFDIWKSMENPGVSWLEMSAILEALELPVPASAPSRKEPAQAALLRALPFVYTRGVFGTVRDAVPDKETAAKLTPFIQGDRLTAFPAVGFQPRDGNRASSAIEYVVLRTIVGVVDRTVITVRLPDRACAAKIGVANDRLAGEPARLVVPRRFLPLRTMPGGRELAEAIGIHQATTARGVAEQVRAQLTVHEQSARTLTDEDPELVSDEEIDRRGLRRKASAAAEETDELAEIAQQLDRKLAQILRRQGSRVGDAPKAAEQLAPAEVERRYEFSLAEIRSLHEDCRLASKIVREAIAEHDQQQSHQFQFFAAVLASIVLVPTLIAGIFGASVDVPAEKSDAAFPVLVGVIGLLAVTSIFALRTAQNHGWKAPKEKFLVPGAAALAILLAYAAFLIFS